MCVVCVCVVGVVCLSLRRLCVCLCVARVVCVRFFFFCDQVHVCFLRTRACACVLHVVPAYAVECVELGRLAMPPQMWSRSSKKLLGSDEGQACLSHCTSFARVHVFLSLAFNFNMFGVLEGLLYN